MYTILYYLPEITLFITIWLLLDLLGSGLFRLLVRPLAKQNWLSAKLENLSDLGGNFPQLWQNYLQQSGKIFEHPSAHLRMRIKGVVRTHGQKTWHPAEGRAFFTVQPLAMVWYADITRAFLVSVKATEQYQGNKAFSTRWILSAIPFRWKKENLPGSLAQRNAFYNLSAAVWQPCWWSLYDLQWAAVEGQELAFSCQIPNQLLFLKARINEQAEMEELSCWTENWQHFQTALHFGDYREFQEQRLPFKVEITRVDKGGNRFTQADLQITDLVYHGDYAWW